MANKVKVSFFQVGDLVKVKASFLSEPAGVTGYVYEAYSIGNKDSAKNCLRKLYRALM
jgi:hypothetical protein